MKNNMKILLIVGDANDIFITNMTKWLKSSMPGVEIDIFSFFLNSNQCQNTYCDNSSYANTNVWHQKIPVFRNLVSPYYYSNELQKFLKGKYYDIIQCHWIVPPLVLTRNLKNYCNKLFATFWGTEWKNFSILNSNKIYKRNLELFLDDVDYIINSKSFKNRMQSLFPQHVNKHIEGYLGSSPLEALYNLMENESKDESKTKMDMDTNKLVVLIGYSGKELHQHLPIIAELSKRNELKNKLHLLTPMTRGAGKDYTDRVQSALEQSGYTYTLLRDKFLSDEEVARLRNVTDVTLQLSRSDGFSRSIIECLCAKSVLIYGDWLLYEDHMKNAGLTGYKVVDIKSGIDKLTEMSEDIKRYEEECLRNSVNGKARNLWSECIKDWVNAYITTK